MNLSREAFQAVVLELEEAKLRELIRRYPDPSSFARPKSYQVRGVIGDHENGAAEAALALVQMAQDELQSNGILSTETLTLLETRIRAKCMLIESWERQCRKRMTSVTTAAVGPPSLFQAPIMNTFNCAE